MTDIDDDEKPSITCFFCDGYEGWYDEDELWVECPYCKLDRTSEPDDDTD